MKETNSYDRCPICGEPMIRRPALSRIDNRTNVCELCGLREAMDSVGVEKSTQEEVIAFVKLKEQE